MKMRSWGMVGLMVFAMAGSGGFSAANKVKIKAFTPLAPLGIAQTPNVDGLAQLELNAAELTFEAHVHLKKLLPSTVYSLSFDFGGVGGPFGLQFTTNAGGNANVMFTQLPTPFVTDDVMILVYRDLDTNDECGAGEECAAGMSDLP